MKKLLLIGALFVIAAGGFLGYSRWKKAGQSPQAYFERGKKFFDDKKYAEAKIEFLNVVQRDPRHKEGRAYMARLFAMEGNLGRSAAQWQAVLEYYPDDVKANLELARIYLAAGPGNPEYIQKAQDLVQKVLAKEPNNVDALVLSGTAAAGKKDFNTSIETLQKAADLDPKNRSASIALGTAQVLKKDLPAAEKTFQKARDADPKDKVAAVSLANFYRAAGDSTKSEAAFKDALAIDPADRRVYLQAVDFYRRAQRFEDAERVLQEAQAKDATNPAPTLDLVGFYQSINRGADARKTLLEIKTKFPNDPQVATTLAMNLMPDQPERAKQEIDQLLKADPKNLVATVLLGEYQFVSGQFEAAEATLNKDPVLKFPAPQVHFFLGNIARQKRQNDQAIDHFQKSLGVNQRYTPARLALAEAFMGNRRLADARVEVQRVLQLEPGNPEARLVRATLDLADKRLPEAEKQLLELAQQYPDNAVVHRQLANYYDAVGKTTEEEKALNRAVELAPNSEDSFRTLILFYLKTKQADRALQNLNGVPDAQKKAFHYELVGIALEQAGKAGDAESAYKKALEKEPYRASTEQLLINQYLQTKRSGDALKILEGRLKKNSADSGALSLRGSIYESLGRIEEAKKSYELALQADANQDVAANNFAYLLADEGKELDTALKWIQGVRNRHPQDPAVADTQAWVYYKMGRTVLARDSAQFAASKAPDNPLYQYHLGVIYKANTQTAQAEAAFKKAVSSSKDFKERPEADAALKDLDHWRHLVK